MKVPLFCITLCFAAGELLSQGEEGGGDQAGIIERYRGESVSVQKDLRTALDELAKIRQGIAGEKPALAKESNRIAADLREARRKADLARSKRDSMELEFAKTDGELKSWREERQYVEGLLLDFERTYRSTQNLALIERQSDLLGKNDLASRMGLVMSVADQVKEAGRVSLIPGEALNEQGMLVQGRFADAGPLSWFLSQDGQASGLISSDSDLRPRIVPGTSDAGNIALLLSGKGASLGFDPTLGAAVALTGSDTSFIGRIEQGGFWIFPILLLAIIALAAAVKKWVQLARIHDLRPALVQSVVDAVEKGDFKAARSAASGIRHPAKNILDRGIDILSQSPNTTRDELEESLYERFLDNLPKLNQGLPLVAIASATAPLLGLLGTVTGMIETFRLINIFGTGDAKSLASGISEALVTTEFGLIVAIPALISHALLSRKVRGVKSSMEMTSLAFLNGIAKQGAKQASPPVPQST